MPTHTLGFPLVESYENILHYLGFVKWLTRLHFVKLTNAIKGRLSVGPINHLLAIIIFEAYIQMSLNNMVPIKYVSLYISIHLRRSGLIAIIRFFEEFKRYDFGIKSNKMYIFHLILFWFRHNSFFQLHPSDRACNSVFKKKKKKNRSNFDKTNF